MSAQVLGAWLASALVLQLATHLALLVGLALRTPRWRAGVALVVPPLAPLWGWTSGMRGRVYAWAFALVAYAIGVAVAR